MNQEIRLVSISTLIFLFNVGCNSSSTNYNEYSVDQNKKSSHEFTHVKYQLHKNQSTGAYYFHFSHLEPGFAPEDRFVTLLNNKGDTIKEINEEEFKYFFNFYTDDKYLFTTTDQYDFYYVQTNSIDSLPPGCYYDGSDYRIHKGAIEYYQNRGVTLCNDSLINQARTLFPNVPNDFEVLDIKGYDCCIINKQIYCNGCQVEDIDTSIHIAIEEKRFKQKHCYPSKNALK